MNTNIICHVLIPNTKGEFLVMRRAENETVLVGHWDIPGGLLDGEESPLHCAAREAQEEAGIDVENLDLAFHTANIDGDKGERFVRLIFISEPVTQEVSLSDEHDKFKWINPGDIPEKIKLVDYLAEILKSIDSKNHQLFRFGV